MSRQIAGGLGGRADSRAVLGDSPSTPKTTRQEKVPGESPEAARESRAFPKLVEIVGFDQTDAASVTDSVEDRGVGAGSEGAKDG